MAQTIETDVLIVGAGPAGAAAALALSKKGIPSVIIDKAQFPRDKICGDALSGKVVEALNRIDRSYAIELSLHTDFLPSWGVNFYAPGGQMLRVPFGADRSRQVAPGFIAKRLVFDNWLADKLKTDNNIRLLQQTEVRDYSRTPKGIEARAKAGDAIQAKIIIACDGAYSTFSRDFAGLKTVAAHNCYGLRAYYKNVAGLDADNFIELHFLKEILPGYFWVFPLPGGYANIGIGMRADKMRARKIDLKKAFESIMQNNPVIQERFKNAEAVGEVKIFGLPLGSVKRKISGDNFLLCGDAAQLIDPFTGEGIGNAMLSALYAAQQVERCLQNNDYSARAMGQFDDELYHRLWPELLLSYRMQQLVNYPSIFNFVVRKANSNKVLAETISCMFEDLEVRARLKDPLFYLKLLFA
jgi:menaquinone-9 beta-reductase